MVDHVCDGSQSGIKILPSHDVYCRFSKWQDANGSATK
jgi:hypothetical protein